MVEYVEISGKLNVHEFSELFKNNNKVKVTDGSVHIKASKITKIDLPDNEDKYKLILDDVGHCVISNIALTTRTNKDVHF